MFPPIDLSWLQTRRNEKRAGSAFHCCPKTAILSTGTKLELKIRYSGSFCSCAVTSPAQCLVAILRHFRQLLGPPSLIMRRLRGFFAILILSGCAKVISVERLPNITLGEATFFPTIEAHTDAAIVGGNRIDILLNGDDTFPVMLRDIKAAKSTITFAQYLFEGGSLAKEFAEAFAERCRNGIKADILLDSHGSGSTPAEILSLMARCRCHVEFFRRVDAPSIIFPWKLLNIISQSPAHSGHRWQGGIYRRLWHQRQLER